MIKVWIIPVLVFSVFLLLFCWLRKSDTDPDRYRRKLIESYHIEGLSENTDGEAGILPFIKAQAAGLYQKSAFHNAAITLWKISEEGDRPLLVLIMGEFNTGKSTFINAILQEDVLVTDGLPATAVVSLLRYGEKKKVILHYVDGHQKEYRFRKLSDITAEGNDAKQNLRNQLEYVEIFLPNELLKEIQIIDTPGLNVNKDSHIRRTMHFQDKPDIVLWVFNATRSPTRTECKAIDHLGNRLKPFAVVNRTDEIDEEEESVDEVLSRIEKRMGSSIQGIVGISSLLAGKAIKAEDQKMLQDAGWIDFQKFLQERVVEKRSVLKQESMIDKLEEFSGSFQDEVEKKQAACTEQAAWFSNAEEERRKIEKEIAQLQDRISRIRSYHEILSDTDKKIRSFCAYENVDLCANRQTMKDNMSFLLSLLDKQIEDTKALSNLSGEKKFSQQIEIVGVENADDLKGKVRQYDKDLNGLENEMADIDEEKREIDTLQVEYNHSGIFGGEPIFDFSGRRERLNQKKQEFSQHIDKTKALAQGLWRQYGSLSKEALDIMAEMKRLSEAVCDAADRVCRERNRFIQDFANNIQEKKTSYDKACADVVLGKQVLQKIRCFLIPYRQEAGRA